LTALSLAFLKLLALAAPLSLLAMTGRIFPDRSFVRLALVPAVATLGLLFTPAMLMVTFLIDLVLAVVVTIDLFTLPTRRDFSFTREVGRVASLAKRHRVRLGLVNQSQRTYEVSIRDDAPPILHPDPDHFAGIESPPRSRIELEYVLRPGRRGAFKLEEVYLRACSRWGLWQKFITYAVASQVNVYPDMQQLGQYAILARTNRLSQLGVRRTRRIGQDHDFERLRDYTRLHPRRQLQTHGLAGDRSTSQADRQGLPGHAKPTRYLPRRLRANDDQHVGRSEPPRPRLQRHAHA
jgi:hypothetical protein